MNSTVLFLPELILIASILSIPAIYIATNSTKSYSICSNISLFVSLLIVILFWYSPEQVSFDKSSSSYVIYDHFVIYDFYISCYYCFSSFLCLVKDNKHPNKTALDIMDEPP